MNRRRIGLLLEIGFPVALLIGLMVWSSASTSFFFPPVTDMLRTFGDTWLFDRFGTDVVPSLYRLIAGFLLACVLGVAGGIGLALSSTAARAAQPLIEFLRAVPPPALIPFGMLVIGLGDTMKILIIAIVCLFPILLNTIDGVNSIDGTLRQTALVYGLRGQDRLTRMVLPAASPQILAGMRTSLSLALIMMVVSELVASTNGIGFFVLQAQRDFAIPEMWSGIILLGLLGYLLNAGLGLAERYALAWQRRVAGVDA